MVVDPLMTVARSQEAKQELMKLAPGKTRAIIFTHSHIDHVGGAEAWLDEGTEIWATDAFTPHFLKQYAVFQPAEEVRGAGQFGEHVPESHIPCSALGKRVDMVGVRDSGARLPTHTFSGAVTLSIGGMTIELYEAHGETHDQLFVWLPDQKVLMPGDNFYHAFPNLYTIRGTAPRPVDKWIDSLDHMRRQRPEVLAPSHTIPVTGAAEIEATLRDYRDAIQWVRDQTVRQANAGRSIDEIAASMALPAHLAEKRFLDELYGQVDWSARAIYMNNLGWFDGTPIDLYPVVATNAAKREVELMGGAEPVGKAAADAMAADDFAWAAHLYTKLSMAGIETLVEEGDVRLRLAEAYEGMSSETANSNGRGYLLESAYRIRKGYARPDAPVVDDELLERIPAETFFKVMTVRLKPDEAAGVHESLLISLTDSGEDYHIVVRNGIAQITRGEAMPDAPKPVATLTTDSMTWKRLALQIQSPAMALASGKLSIDGSIGDLLTFLGRFEQGM